MKIDDTTTLSELQAIFREKSVINATVRRGLSWFVTIRRFNALREHRGAGDSLVEALNNAFRRGP